MNVSNAWRTPDRRQRRPASSRVSGARGTEQAADEARARKLPARTVNREQRRLALGDQQRAQSQHALRSFIDDHRFGQDGGALTDAELARRMTGQGTDAAIVRETEQGRSRDAFVVLAAHRYRVARRG